VTGTGRALYNVQISMRCDKIQDARSRLVVRERRDDDGDSVRLGSARELD
jgi:hypothetical protein